MSQPATARSSVYGQGRRLLLASARELFADRGYSGTSTRDIAERAGVSEPMLFRHFGSKANLFQEAAVAPFVEFMDTYIQDYRSREHVQLTADEEGRRLFEGLVGALREQRELLIALMSARPADQPFDEVSRQVRQAFAHLLELFEEVVANESRERGFTDFDLAASVRVMFGMALSVALHGDWLGLGEPVSHERMVAAMTTMSVKGLGVPPR